MLLLGYNEIEQQQLDDIDARYKAKGFQPILIPTSEIPDTEEYYKTFDEYLRETREVLQQAEKREIEYFSQHISELTTNIYAGIKKLIIDVNNTYSSELMKPLLGSGFNDDVKLKDFIISNLALHLELLKNKAPKDYQETIKFVDNAVSNKDKIIRQASKPVISVKTSRAKKIKSDTTKIGRMIMKRPDNDKFYDEQNIQVLTGKMKRTNIIVSVSLEIEELKKQGLSVPFADRLTLFDKAVFEACTSLYEVGNTYMTSDMIYSTLSGNKKETKLTDNMRKEIFDSLKKLRTTSITINAEEEFSTGRNKRASFHGVLLPNSIIEEEIITLNGRETKDCIKILDKSPLISYAEGKNQIREYNTEMLDALVNNTREAIELKTLLVHRIIDMYNPNNKLGNIIRYDTIFEHLQIGNEKDNTTLTKKKRIRQLVRTILDDWKKRDIIKDYEELNEDGKKPKSREPIAKIKIALNKAVNKEEILQ